MIVPEYLKKDDLIGITACSCGILSKIDEYNEAYGRLEENYKIIETDDVRRDGLVSTDKLTRAWELESLYKNNDCKAIMVAAGGDFLFEMLENVNFYNISNNIKWICGSSDPTSLLFSITTKLDIATIYSPCNVCGLRVKHLSISNYFEILSGNLVKQYRNELYEGERSNDSKYNLTKVNKWFSNKDIDEKGILIGGCIDVLKDIIGTKYDGSSDFLLKYGDEGIIWYFDIFGLSSESLYNTLLQFKYAGWFDKAKLIVLGKVMYPNSNLDFEYKDAISNALDGYNYIYNFDIGHVKPSFTMVNGLMVRIVSNDDEGYMEYIK